MAALAAGRQLELRLEGGPRPHDPPGNELIGQPDPLRPVPGAGVRRQVGGHHGPAEVGEAGVAGRQVVEPADDEPLVPLGGHVQGFARRRLVGVVVDGIGRLPRPPQSVVQLHHHAVERPRQHLAEGVRLHQARFDGEVVVEVPQVVLALQLGLRELAREPGERRRVADVAVLLGQDPVTELGATERRDHGHHVGDGLVHGERLGRGGVVEVGRDPVEDGVARLVGDDVLGEAGVDRLVVGADEREELQALGAALVEGVGLVAGEGHDQQLRRVEGPVHPPAQGVGLLEHLDRLVDDPEHAHRGHAPLRGRSPGRGHRIGPKSAERLRRHEPSPRAQGPRFVEIEDRDTGGNRPVEEDVPILDGDELGPVDSLELAHDRVLDEDRDSHLHDILPTSIHPGPPPATYQDRVRKELAETTPRHLKAAGAMIGSRRP